mgnify:CR=1 FL=1
MTTTLNTLCIPRVFPSISQSRIRTVFTALDMCDIGKIDLVRRVDSKGISYNSVYLHVDNWYIHSPNGVSAIKRLSQSSDIKVVYDEPWFWKVSAYRKPSYKPIPATSVRGPYLDLDTRPPQPPPGPTPKYRRSLSLIDQAQVQALSDSRPPEPSTPPPRMEKSCPPPQSVSRPSRPPITTTPTPRRLFSDADSPSSSSADEDEDLVARGYDESVGALIDYGPVYTTLAPRRNKVARKVVMLTDVVAPDVVEMI